MDIIENGILVMKVELNRMSDEQGNKEHIDIVRTFSRLHVFTSIEAFQILYIAMFS